MSDRLHELSPRGREVFAGLCRWLEHNAYPPTIRELGAEVGLSSTRTVSDYLKNFESLGLIRRHRNSSRAIELLVSAPEAFGPTDEPEVSFADRVQIPIVGEVAAGSPILAAENLDGSLGLDATMVRDSRSYFLRVRGESMIEAQICDGDLVLIQPQQEASNGEIVVVMIDDEVTLKRFYRRDGYLELRPENSSMASIIVTPEMGEVRVLGRPVGVWRTL
jgi:repressor LexA